MNHSLNFTHITLEQCRQQANDLLDSFKAGDPRTLDRIRWNHPRFHGQKDDAVARGEFGPADAELVVAKLHYFESWPNLLEYIQEVENSDPPTIRFEAAADAIISGEVAKLGQMLKDHPELIRQRSMRAHHAPLLHYVSANGVENYRQVTPDNVLEVASVLLKAGAEVDAVSDAYGGGSTALGLVATSAHPRAKRLQIPLIDLLLKHGAKIDGDNDLQNLVRGALANGCPEASRALVRRGAHLRTIYAAAGNGDLERVRSRFDQSNQRQREEALLVAAQEGHLETVRFLLDHGVDVSASGDMMALHYAAAGGHLDVIELLLERGAELEKLNTFGGTVLDSTLWFARHLADEQFKQCNFPRVIERLIAAGARTDVYPTMQQEIDAVYQRALIRDQ